MTTKGPKKNTNRTTNRGQPTGTNQAAINNITADTATILPAVMKKKNDNT
jgi:hypothetical protein